MEHDNRLENITLEQLESEVVKRKQEQTQKLLDQSSFEQLTEEVKVKEEEEYQKLYSEMFPEQNEESTAMYPKMKEANEKKVRDILKYRIEDNRTVEEKLYPSLFGGK